MANNLLELHSLIGHQFYHRQLKQCKIVQVSDDYIIVETMEFAILSGKPTNRFKLIKPQYIPYSFWNVSPV